MSDLMNQEEEKMLKTKKDKVLYKRTIKNGK